MMLTQRTQPSTGASLWIDRFTRTHRLLHWSNALAFLALAATGFGLHVPPLRRALDAVLALLPPLLGHPLTIIDFHVLIAVFYVAGPLVWIVCGNRRALLADARAIAHLDADDRRWLAHVAAQDAVATLLAFGGFVVTGLLLTFWPNTAIGAASPLVTPAGLRHVALVLHMLLALASVALLAGHVYLAALNPATRHSVQGMLRGRVRREWAREHHATWVAAVEEQAQAQARPRP
jgi:formate dehydrogenase subunit gamma